MRHPTQRHLHNPENCEVVVVTGASAGVGRAMTREFAAHGASYDAQQTNEPVEPDRRSNLDDPMPDDYGARGRFDDRAIDYSVQAWINRHRGWLALGGLAALSTLYLTARRSP
jgi:hypothetical protein